MVYRHPEKSMYFWVRVSRNPKRQEMILFFGDEGDFNYFKGRNGYPCFFLITPPGSALSFWTINNAGATFTDKQNAAKTAAKNAATAGGWFVVDETDQIKAFYNT
tara:strand:- start:2427 stop:2741 length:315 start_codon:yes stop_codon:yes gene_type:complete